MISDRTIAITGIGVVSPLGVGRGEFWRALASGETGASPPDEGLAVGGVPVAAARVRDFEARALVASPLLRRMDDLSRWIVASCRLALTDAGLAPTDLAPERVGIAVGTAYGDSRGSAQQLDKLYGRGAAAVSPMLFPNLVLNAPASYAALELGVTGPNLTLAQNETSAEQAILAACDLVAEDGADLVLAGGGEVLSPIVAAIYMRSGALTRERARPYDRDRSGAMLGEGACMLALEDLDRARRRGARVLAIMRSGITFGLPVPRRTWPRCALAALPVLRSIATDVDLVIGAGNGTRLLDAAELELVSALAEERADELPLTSLKGAVGEIAGGGALGIAAAALALTHQVIPPTVGLEEVEEVEPGHRVRAVARIAQPCSIQRALALALARGGSGTALVLERAG